jgi:hydroxymethylbilane synthase
LGGGCQVPIGANAELKGDKLHMIAAVCSLDGKHRILERLSGNPTCADELGSNLVTKLIQGGASKL